MPSFASYICGWALQTLDTVLIPLQDVQKKGTQGLLVLHLRLGCFGRLAREFN